MNGSGFRKSALTAAAAALLLAAAAFAQGRGGGRGAAAQAAAPDAPVAAGTAAVPAESSAITQHEMTLDGKPLKYTATAGTLLIDGDDGKPYGSVFYVAYTADGDSRTRPVTFLYNGGPGSASLWLHMGSVGPVRVVTESPAASGAAPYKLVPNEHTLLDKTDLVFIDAVGTGFSKPVGTATIHAFAGADQDVTAFRKFIERYVEVNHRWNSPKFLFGESYGTPRSAALADQMEEAGMSLNGVVLMSTILNYFDNAPGSNMTFIGNLPSYAAIAWHYEKVQRKGRDESAFLNEVRAFARGPYADALLQGHNLPEAQVNAIAAKLASYTGLSTAFIKEANLRVSPVRFRKELLRDQRMIVGRYDARFEGTDVDAAGETPGYDPSSTGISGAFVASFHDYLDRELKYNSRETYFVRGPNVNQIWDHTHKLPGAGNGAAAPSSREIYVVPDLADAMRKNPRLRVFSVNGLYDLATPFFMTEMNLAQMNLEPKLRTNVEFAYYPSGHMIYLNVDALKQLKKDLAAFYTRAAGR